MDRANIQALVLAPYRYRRSRYLFFTLPPGPGNGRGFIRKILPCITHGAVDLTGDVPWLCNVALTFEGLKRVGCNPDLSNRLDRDFRQGPDPESLGDVEGSSSDRRTWWDGQWRTQQIHLMVLLYTREGDAEGERPESKLAEATSKILEWASAEGWVELLPRQNPDHNGSRRLNGAALLREAGDLNPGSKVHFGYRDGLSQPDVAWEGPPAENQLDRSHFLLGYSSPEISSSPSRGPAADFFRDSSYLVLRWIQQDVAAFENFLTSAAPVVAPDRSPEDGRELVAAKLMGRWRNGVPLTLSPDSPAVDQPGVTTAPFSFQQQDAGGLRCPFSAHIRVVNPRDQPLSSFEVVGVPRVIRRGMPYGPELPKWSGTEVEDDEVDRGVVGVFLCVNIARQIYTILHWVAMNNFSPVFTPEHLHDQDSIFGNRKITRANTIWTIPIPGGEKPIRQLPDFVHTRGTGFFILPSLSCLRDLAE